MRTPRISAAVVALIVAGAGFALSTASFASAAPSTTAPGDPSAPPVSRTLPDLATAKTACIATIDARQVVIAKLTGALDAPRVTDLHRSTQKAHLADAAAGLATLKEKIGTDSTPADLKSDCQSVFSEYRIYALRAPQTHLIIAGDREAAAIDRLNGVIVKLQAAIDTATGAGKDTAAAQAALDDMKIKVADAAAKAAGLGDSVIGFVPSDWNANHAVLAPARTAASAAHADLQAAAADARAVIAALKKA